jgi:hypothetical protein
MTHLRSFTNLAAVRARLQQAASSPWANRSIRVSRKQRADDMEAVLRRADATLETWFRRSKKWGAGALRQRLDDLQGGLKTLSARLEQVEQAPKVAPAKRATRPTVARKPAARRKPKKAA